MTDAGAYWVGDVLLKNRNKDWRPISFTSCHFRLTMMSRPVHQKKPFAVVHYRTNSRRYLHGETFVVVVDP